MGFKVPIFTIIILLIGLFLFFYLTDIRDGFRQNDKEEFKGQTEGEIISVTPINRIQQSRWKGTEIFIDSYKIIYRYKVHGTKFESTDIIPNTTKNEKHLNTILNRKASDIFMVHFNFKDPSESILTE